MISKTVLDQKQFFKQTTLLRDVFGYWLQLLYVKLEYMLMRNLLSNFENILHSLAIHLECKWYIVLTNSAQQGWEMHYCVNIVINNYLGYCWNIEDVQVAIWSCNSTEFSKFLKSFIEYTYIYICKMRICILNY